MSRMALFVDAGYLLAGAHDLMGGPSIKRSAYDCNYEALLPALHKEVQNHGAPYAFLRTYWYDGARDGIPTADHRRIGDMHYVKVRLGRLNRRGQQKGVDGLIYRDLTTLARAGAVQRAYLFTGDEDIRESVAAAQDLGVQVVLIAFRPTLRTGRSAELAREADEVIVLDPSFWKPHFKKREAVAAASEPPSTDVLAPIAQSFAKDWVSGATAAELAKLLKGEPYVPRELYVQLLLAAEATTGSLKDYGAAKGELRTEFWRALKQEVEQTSTSDEDEESDSEETEG
jgi:uncharacterized LabA/DUF88 family protein